MKINRLLLGMMALALVPTSCSRHQDTADGNVLFSVATDGQVDVVTKSNVSDYTTLPQTGKFTIVLTNGSGEEIYNGLLEQFAASKKLKAGNYSVKAGYGSTSEEGFEKPCFTGVKSFSVTGGGTTTVAIPVTLANTIVKVECTDAFKAYYTDYSFTVKTGGGTEIPFSKTETRAAFVDAYMISVSGNLTGQGGKTQAFSGKEFRPLSPKTCYTLKFDVSNVGGRSITISFDEAVEEAELTEVDLND